jgi:hypothetical protein
MARRSTRTATAIAVDAVLVAAVFWWRGRDGHDDAVPTEPALERTGSIEADGTQPLDGREPDGYRITYRVAQRTAAPTSETLTVRRPFASQMVDAAGGGRRTAFGRLITDDAGAEPIVLAVGPTVAGGDVRLAPVVDDAVAAGLLVEREQREVAGRRCQVYRTGAPVADGLLVKPTRREHADVCIDRNGLVLEEWWVVDGRPFRQRVATDVEERAPDDLGADWTALDPSMAVEEGGGSILKVRDDSAPPGELFEAARVPDGFTHLGRYSIIPPQADAFAGNGNRSNISSSTADVWRRGIDVLLVDQGGSLGGRTAFEPDPANRVVDVPGLGAVEVRLGLAANEVRVTRPHGHFVRVVGTLPADELLEVMRGLVATQGTDLVVERDGPLVPPGAG